MGLGLGFRECARLRPCGVARYRAAVVGWLSVISGPEFREVPTADAELWGYGRSTTVTPRSL